MKSFKDVVLGSLGDRPLTLDDLLFQLKTDLDQTLIQDLIEAAVLGRAAAELGLSVSDGELQEAADRVRRDMGLISAQETREWMAQRGLTVEDFEHWVEQQTIRRKVHAAVVTEPTIRKAFAENVLDLETVKIAMIVVADGGLAAEIRTQLDEGEAEFCALAGRYSIDARSAERGGFVGSIHRGELPRAVDAAVFADGASGVLGPLEAEGRLVIVKILEPKKADFDNPLVREFCAKTVFNDYLAEKTTALKVRLDFAPQGGSR